MNSCEIVTLVSSLSCLIAKDKKQEEIILLGAIFTQLGDSLATIAALQDCNNDDNDNNCNFKAPT